MMFGFNLPKKEYKCTVCGQLWFSDEWENCPTCGADKEEVIKVIKLGVNKGDK